ncbi:unnamed protein product, partial [Discosporangium mesarthrocarpum]
RQLSEASCDSVPEGWVAALAAFGILYAFLGLAVVCDEFFQTSLEKISEVLELTPDVAGATFLAAGSSAPELLTSTVDAFGDATSVGMGTIVGSAMFNILVIVALSAAVAGKGGGSLHIDWRPVCRDVIFYTYSIGILSLIFLDNSVQIYESIIMVLSYMGYILFMKYNSSILARCDPAKIEPTDGAAEAAATECMDTILANNSDSKEATKAAAGAVSADVGGGKVAPLPVADEAANEEANSRDDSSIKEGTGGEGGEPGGGGNGTAEGPERRKSMTLGVRNRVERRKSGALHVCGGLESKPLVGADQNRAVAAEAEEGNGSSEKGGAEGGGEAAGGGNVKDEEETESRFDWPDSTADKVLYVAGLPFLVLFTLTIPDCGKPRWEKWYVISFFSSLLWISALTHFMVMWAAMVACRLEVSQIFMGLVVLAIGTSVPDALGSMIAARSGEANMAIANAVGSNVFDILLGLGFPWFLRSVILGEDMPVDRNGIFINVAILFCTVVIFVGVLKFGNWRMNTQTGFFLFALYLVFIIFVVVKELL